ncbi:hypothetical protein INS49_013406 [Diaporthe citri]|uniref:uncharacterized protein n=1 Tax=Diaporthe citri TaxID=83186 RepID=UPI001C821949|nr:uncharacterized protein INS49_013406 [Diaporthe citri]KAG6357529.1 hypothetical protein INS49_013406 [Diaporthe citri]
MASTSLVEPYWARLTSNAENYAQQCYSSKSKRMLDCTLFVKDHLPGSTNQKARCPFNPEICRTDTTNLYLDSGLLDSGKHFGLNTAPSERTLFRSVLHCAPLVTEGYTSTRNTADANYTRYHYGSIVADETSEDITYEYLSRDSQYESGEGFGLYGALRGYGSNFVLANIGSVVDKHTTDVNRSAFVPIPELFRSDGDLEIIFLVGNGIQFYEQTEDAWYRVTDLGNEIFDNTWEGTRTLYLPEEAASPLACVQQFQFCNTALAPEKQCGPLASWNDAVDESASLFNITGSNEDEYLTTDSAASQFFWIVLQMNYAASKLQTLLQTLGPESLASKANLIQGIMGRLPSNQWQLDVTHWWSTYLASVQAAFVETAIGPSDPTGELDQYKEAPWNDHVRKLCNSQKILSSSYTSFSMFGLCFTYAMGILLIVASYAAEPICACLYRRFKFREYAHLEWTTNATLHFQRMAYQGIDSGEWTGEMDSIPMTKAGEMLAELPMRAAATVPHDVSEKGTTDQTGRSREDIELDSLIGGDDGVVVVSSPNDSTGRN